MSFVMVLLVLILVVAVAVIAATAAASAIAARSERMLPPAPPPSGWQGYQGPNGPVYPAYSPAQYLSPDDRERILVLIRSGQKMQAIKLYRGATGAGLAEATAAVEHLERYR